MSKSKKKQQSFRHVSGNNLYAFKNLARYALHSADLFLKYQINMQLCVYFEGSSCLKHAKCILIFPKYVLHMEKERGQIWLEIFFFSCKLKKILAKFIRVQSLSLSMVLHHTNIP